MKSTKQWSEVIWYVECPYCDKCMGGEQSEFALGEIECEHCEEIFIITDKDE